MDLINYQSISPKLKTSKAIRTNNADLTVDTKLVLGSNGYKDNYGFILFPVDPTKTTDGDYYFIIHAQSGYPIAPKDESQSDGDKLVLMGFDGSYDQQWSFINRDNKGFLNINNRSSGFNWKVKNGETSDGTNIVIHSPSGNDNSFFEFNPQIDQDNESQYKTIPRPELVGYTHRTDQSLNDISKIPIRSDNPDWHEADPYLIGECSIPFYVFDVFLNSENSNKYISNVDSRTFPEQVSDTPYYVLKRYQYWKITQSVFVRKNRGIDEDISYIYGADQQTLDNFSGMTDWALTSDFTIFYGQGSNGISTVIADALEINSSSTNTDYSEQNSSIYLENVSNVDQTIYIWQIVDVLELCDGSGSRVDSLEIPGEAVTISIYDEEEATEPSY